MSNAMNTNKKRCIICVDLFSDTNFGVTTLALGSQLKQRLAKVQNKNEAWESHFMLPGV
jgi:hypothetical protein